MKTNFSDLNNRLDKLTNFAEKKDKPFGDDDKKIIDLLIKNRPQHAYNFIRSYYDINPNISEKADNYYLSKVSIDDIVEININASPYNDDKIELSNEQIAKLIIGKYKEKLTKKNIKKYTTRKNGVIFGGDVYDRLNDIDYYICALNGWRHGGEVDDWVYDNIARMVIPKVIDTKCITDDDSACLEAGNIHHMCGFVQDEYDAVPSYYRQRRNPYGSYNPYDDDDDDDDDNPYGWR